MTDCYDGAFCSYYGSMENIKTKYKVHHFVIDELLKNIVEKNAESFRKEVSKMVSNFKKDALYDLISIKDQLRTLKTEDKKMLAKIEKIAKHVNLKLEDKPADKDKAEEPEKDKDVDELEEESEEDEQENGC